MYYSACSDVAGTYNVEAMCYCTIRTCTLVSPESAHKTAFIEGNEISFQISFPSSSAGSDADRARADMLYQRTLL